jgi:hypothetical protein
MCEPVTKSKKIKLRPAIFFYLIAKLKERKGSKNEKEKYP